MWKIILSSGNIFWYTPGDENHIAVAFASNPSKEFLGGFAGLEATRKFVAFEKLATAESCKSPNIKDFNLDAYAEKLGAAQPLFINGLFSFNDNDHCNGTSSIAETCDSRQDYYKAVGLQSLYGSSIKCPFWALIANHLSMFGAKHFRESFFRGGDFQKDLVSEMPTRYYKGSWRAPAAYCRALSNLNKGG